jgi:hypothetical protein
MLRLCFAGSGEGNQPPVVNAKLLIEGPLALAGRRTVHPGEERPHRQGPPSAKSETHLLSYLRVQRG